HASASCTSSSARSDTALRCGRGTGTQAKRLAVRIEQHPPAAGAGLEVRLTGSDRAQALGGLVEVVDLQVEVEAFGASLVRPPAGPESLDLAEADSDAVAFDPPVTVVAGGDLPAERGRVEPR